MLVFYALWKGIGISQCSTRTRHTTMDAAENKSMKRSTVTGVWILDKSRGTPSMRGYLETMGVTELAIEAHEKGEEERDTIHTIILDTSKQTLQIVKRSRVNNDITLDLELGKELVATLPPGDRVKKTVAVSENPQHIEIRSSLNTMNGMARVTDVKRLIQETDKSVLIQELTVVNEQNGKSHLTTRYFNPYLDTPPHLAKDDAMQVC